MKSDCSLIDLANVGQESHERSRQHGIIRFFIRNTDPGPKTSISHELNYFETQFPSNFLENLSGHGRTGFPAMAGQAGLPSTALRYATSVAFHYCKA